MFVFKTSICLKLQMQVYCSNGEMASLTMEVNISSKEIRRLLLKQKITLLDGKITRLCTIGEN